MLFKILLKNLLNSNYFIFFLELDTFLSNETNFEKIGCTSHSSHQILIHHSLKISLCFNFCHELGFVFTIRKNS